MERVRLKRLLFHLFFYTNGFECSILFTESTNQFDSAMNGITEKFLQNRMVVFIFLVLVWIVPLVFYSILRFKQSRSLPVFDSDSQQYVSRVREATPMPQYQFTNPVGQITPYGFTWNPGNNWEISGYVVQNDLSDSGRLVLAVPDKFSGKTIAVVAEFSPGSEGLLTMFLSGGMKQETMSWVHRPIDEISTVLRSGSQVVVTVEHNQLQARFALEKGRSDGYLFVTPIKAIVAGVYE